MYVSLRHRRLVAETNFHHLAVAPMTLLHRLIVAGQLPFPRCDNHLAAASPSRDGYNFPSPRGVTHWHCGLASSWRPKSLSLAAIVFSLRHRRIVAEANFPSRCGIADSLAEQTPFSSRWCPWHCGIASSWRAKSLSLAAIFVSLRHRRIVAETNSHPLGDAHGHGPYLITNGERILLSAWLKQGRDWLML
jgi:hypothetical protein